MQAIDGTEYPVFFTIHVQIRKYGVSTPDQMLDWIPVVQDQIAAVLSIARSRVVVTLVPSHRTVLVDTYGVSPAQSLELSRLLHTVLLLSARMSRVAEA